MRKSIAYTCLLTFCVVSSFTSFSQTKKIWHKSHSGTSATYHNALQHNLFDIDNSNFGLSILKIYVESIRKINDTSIVINYYKYDPSSVKADPKSRPEEMAFTSPKIKSFKTRQQVIDWLSSGDLWADSPVKVKNPQENFPVEGFNFKSRK